MDDPIQRHPTRAEQLDLMADIIADRARPGDRVLDLGCGTGYFAHLLTAKRRDLAFTGIDLSDQALDAARRNFPASGFEWVQGNLGDPSSFRLPDRYRFVTSGLVFHDLANTEKQALIDRIAGLLEEDGVFLLYDRIRLTSATLFPLQKAIWRRLERIHGTGMRATDDFPTYEAELNDRNMPATLDDYRHWFNAAGLEHMLLHLHGNIAIIAASRRS